MPKAFTELKSLAPAFNSDERDSEKIISDGRDFLKQPHAIATEE